MQTRSEVTDSITPFAGINAQWSTSSPPLRLLWCLRREVTDRERHPSGGGWEAEGWQNGAQIRSELNRSTVNWYLKNLNNCELSVECDPISIQENNDGQATRRIVWPKELCSFCSFAAGRLPNPLFLPRQSLDDATAAPLHGFCAVYLSSVQHLPNHCHRCCLNDHLLLTAAPLQSPPLYAGGSELVEWVRFAMNNYNDLPIRVMLGAVWEN